MYSSEKYRNFGALGPVATSFYEEEIVMDLIKTRITDMFKIDYPIIQGGMAWVAEHKLVSAVSEAGGLGILAAANAQPEHIRDEIKKVKSLTSKPFAINIMLMSPYADQIADIIVEEKVKIVTTGAGNPEKHIDKWHKAGICVIPVVASVAQAKRMERSGADAIIAEGTEAGGHIGQMTTIAMIPQIVDAVSIPVIAAGGIGDARGYLAARFLGADGIQMGTRFIVSKESVVHNEYKERIIGARDIDTIITGQSTGIPIRSLKNKMTKTYLDLERTNASREEMEKIGMGSLRNAVIDGDVTHGTVMAGQIAGLIRSEETCSDIIQGIFDGAKKLLLKVSL